jgi:hypothetical protein
MRFLSPDIQKPDMHEYLCFVPNATSFPDMVALGSVGGGWHLFSERNKCAWTVIPS